MLGAGADSYTLIMGYQFKDTYKYPKSPWGTPPGVINEEFKTLTTTGSSHAIYSADIIKVEAVQGQINTYNITWPEIPDALSYTIFLGFSLFLSQATEAATISATTYNYTHPVSVPPSTLLNVWIRANFDNSSKFIQNDPANSEHILDYLNRNNNPLENNYANVTVDNDYMRFFAAEVRRRAIVMQQNDGEEFIIFNRRWTGTPCACASTDANMVNGSDAIQGAIIAPDQGIGEEPANITNPKYSGLAGCPICFGTGIKGGYYYGLSTLMRYGNLPERRIIFKKYSLEIPHNFNTWTVWEPRFHSQDIVYRKKTGEYFLIEDSGRGEWRGIPFHQEAKLNMLPPDDPRCVLTDSYIASVE